MTQTRLFYEIIPDSPARSVLVVSHGRMLVAVEIGLLSVKDARTRAAKRFPLAVPARTSAATQLREYFAGKRRAFDLDVELGGLGPFHTAALRVCGGIPFGCVATYGQVAEAAGSARAARAVGGAMRVNPAPIVIPCHRVVASDGLGGFMGRGGLDIKRALLELEGAHLPARGMHGNRMRQAP